MAIVELPRDMEDNQGEYGTAPDGPVEKKEVLSPAARLFHAPKFNCYIVTVIGFKTHIDPEVIKAGIPVALLKHPRFSSKMVGDFKRSRKMKWSETTVNLDDHVIVPDIDPDQDSPDRFVEDYISYLTTTPLDSSRPLWEMHILNIKTSDAEAVMILRVHHSAGDGASLMSFFLACTRKTSDPETLPTLPAMTQARTAGSGLCGFWWLVSMIMLVWNSFLDGLLFVATIIFLKDTETPIKGDTRVSDTTKRFVHRMVSLDDIKLVKNELNMTINDVLLGATQAGLSRYLSGIYAEGTEMKKVGFLNKIRLRGIIAVNLRPAAGIQALSEMIEERSTVKWGNLIGYIICPLSVGLQKNPLAYVHQAKAAIDRKKHSVEAFITSLTVALILKIFGSKAGAAVVHRFFFNMTFGFSNMVGPIEEVGYCGYPIAYIAPSIYGVPLALVIHFQSYADKMTICLAVDPEAIPDPHLLLDDLVDSLNSIKAAVL